MPDFVRLRTKTRSIPNNWTGWIRTALGGESAPITMEEAIPMVADTLLAARATPGMHYLDRFGATVPW